MTAKISNITELFHRFHNCEMQLKQGKIAACLIAFREVIDRMPSIPKTEKEKSELHAGIEVFLRNLSNQKKFQEIFGEVHFGDTDLETNLEFIKSMIAAQEEDIVERVKNEEAALEAQRLEIDQEQQRQNEALRKKIAEAIERLEHDDAEGAKEIIGESEDIREAVVHHFNDAGMKNREASACDEAVKNYARALMLAPEDENLYYNLGRAHLEAGRSDKAENALASAMALNPDFTEGEALYTYLLKLNAQKPPPAADEPQKPASGFLKKLFGK